MYHKTVPAEKELEKLTKKQQKQKSVTGCVRQNK